MEAAGHILAQVDPEDIVMLVLSWHFRAATMCEYSHEEFVSGMLRLRCDSLPKLQQKLPELRRDLQDAQTYKASPLCISTVCRSLPQAWFIIKACNRGMRPCCL